MWFRFLNKNKKQCVDHCLFLGCNPVYSWLAFTSFCLSYQNALLSQLLCFDCLDVVGSLLSKALVVTDGDSCSLAFSFSE